MTSQENRTWARQFDPHVQLIICQALRVITVASDEDDMRRNTDFQLIYTSPKPELRIAARVRRHEYLDCTGPVAGEFPNEITFRYSLPNRRRTEWQKMLDGWGDFMVYGFAEDDEGDRLCRWVVINLALMRQHAQHAEDDWRPGMLRPSVFFKNDDGTWGIAWRLLDLACCPRCLGLVHTSHGNPILSNPALLDAYRRRLKEDRMRVSEHLTQDHALPERKPW